MTRHGQGACDGLRSVSPEVAKRSLDVIADRAARADGVGDASSAYGYGDRGLAWELLTCLKWLWRGDVAAAKRYLIALGKAIDASEASEARAKV
ncbi:hypothetical protein WCQ02_33850 [Paraburkholderia tropica]|uniref:hypothetical protein n=1 Tax=Paraburkholderia tropica TaxID=92647 RepID=UPI003017DA36